MTDKLYYSKPYLKTFEAVVLACVQDGDTYLIELNQTAFYPEGGGQPSDTGYLNSEAVLEVIITDDLIQHRTRNPLTVGSTCQGTLNWDRRFQHMQQHLGQHLLSALFKTLFDAATVGFHMGDDYVTVDLDKKLVESDIWAAEDAANEAVFRDEAVEALYPEDDDLANMPLRKMPKVTENIRIIKVENFDHTPCGGTHPSTTGQVGLIKIRKFYNHKTGVRVEFVCGRLALLDYREKSKAVATIATDLSVKDNEILDAYDRLKSTFSDANDRLKSLKLQLSGFEAERLLARAEILGNWKLVQGIMEGYDFNDLKNISSSLATACPTAIRVFLCVAPDKSTLLIEIPENNLGLSAKTLLKTALDTCGGKGGGSDKSAQGSSPDTEALKTALGDTLDSLRRTLA